jgi:hypothetical protein
MGTIEKGYLEGFSGILGAAVGSKWKGKSVVEYGETPAQPCFRPLLNKILDLNHFLLFFFPPHNTIGEKGNFGCALAFYLSGVSLIK